ncbi:unnamed protein product [Lactuca virosa]|uniref:F-box associated beta-propeller type 1 domain-containing protein n=1 Tax=Lactuca virosa TaxID=75947 RepID=A0AAU9N885_9ASTR|nr:unnamed protein product [Lactuca virosa]
MDCVAVHGVVLMRQKAILGFRVCPIASDPTIVKIDGPVIEVFTLSTGSWKTLPSNLQINSIKFSWRHVVIDRFIYWFSYGENEKPLIVSFDMTTHEFRTTNIPDSLAQKSSSSFFSISKVSEGLAVLKFKGIRTGGWDVWIMDDGVPNSCTKLFTINNIPGSVGYYMETLLLLDQPDSSVYVENSVGPMDFMLWINSLREPVEVSPSQSTASTSPLAKPPAISPLCLC